MNLTRTLLVLFIAASLEAGGDALVRAGLRSTALSARVLFMIAGACILFAYGYTVNTPNWDFGRLIGFYVVFFFLTAQLISSLVFRQRPDSSILIGGCLIVLGGFIISAGAVR
jgi:drug/metabolite transporter superfamily protein YnfA